MDLKRERNAHVPFCRLPVELQIQIFREDTADRNSGHLLRRVISLSGVSSRWRAVVVGTPRLWTYASTNHPDILDLVLARSATAPLDVDVITSPKNMAEENTVYTVAQHHQRWRSLRWRGRHMAPLYSALQNPSPLLEILHLEYGSGLSPSSGKVVHIGGGPRLSDLFLANVFPANPDTITLTHLKTLSLRDLCPLEEELLALLASCQNLEWLKLKHAAHIPSQSTDTITITLPRLKGIDTYGCGVDVLNSLVSAIQAEALATLQVAGSDTEGSFLAALRRTDKANALPATVLRNATPDSIALRWGGSDVVFIASTGETNVLRLDFNEVTWDQAMEGILEFFPSGQIDIPIELILEHYSSNFAAIRLNQLPNIVKISIGDEIEDEAELREFLLHFAQPQRADDGELRWLAPNLSQIRLKELRALGGPVRDAISLLTRRRGRGGGLGGSLSTEVVDWEGAERPLGLTLCEGHRV